MSAHILPTRMTLIRGPDEYPITHGYVLFEESEGPTLLFYIAESGLGIAPITRYSERGPAQHGDTDLGFRLEPRTISLILAVSSPPIETPAYLERARNVLIRRFRPSSIPIKLRYDRSDGSVRQIDGHFASGMTFDSQDRDQYNWFQRFSVDFKMNNPVWYDPEALVETVTHTTFGTGFLVPTPVPTFFGDPIFASEEAFEYNGTWESYPILRINGPIINPTIYHDELDLTIPFTRNIGAGEYIELDLSAKPLTIKNQSGASMYQYLDDPNDLSTFRLVGEPDVLDSINTIRMTGHNADGGTNLTITYLKRYIGI